MNPVRPYRDGGAEKKYLKFGMDKRYINGRLKGDLIG